MSSRVLRKLQGRDNELKTLAALGESSSDDEDLDIKPAAPRNSFAMLNESASDEGETVEISNDENNHVTSEQTQIKSSSNQTKKKKRTRKKKRKDDEEKTEDSDDIEKLIKEVESMEASGSNNHTKNIRNPSKKPKYILSVEHRLLNPDNELRRIFGARTLMGDANFRHRNQVKVSRGTWLTAPTPSWPKMSKTGLTMKCIENSKKYQYFTFEHNKEYQEAQFKFLDAVDSSDHNQIAMSDSLIKFNFAYSLAMAHYELAEIGNDDHTEADKLLVLKENNNYHVDSLLTLSDMCRINDDSQMARELLERGLYCLERNFHSQFNLTTGTCRLPYKRLENRCFFLALYRHLHFVFQRGCSKTALELCKVLLNLDPDEDPLCVLLFIDFFALQAAEYQFLIQLSSEWEMHKNLSQLPNFAYSLAMAHYELAEIGNDDHTEADKLLQDALIKFPSVLMPLLEKCSIQPDQKISSHSFFTSEATQSSPDGLQLLCNLFVARNHLLWKSREVLSWVERNVNSVLERVDSKDQFVVKSRQKRKKYQKPPLNIYRYTMICELPGVTSLLPPEIRLGQMLSHDPLPPPDTIASYTRAERVRRGRSDNPLGLFFHSLLPNFDPTQEAPEMDGAVGGHNLDQAGIRARVQTLMEAMRDMLGTFQLPENEEDPEPEFQEDEWD